MAYALPMLGPRYSDRQGEGDNTVNGIEAIRMAARVGQSIEMMARGETHVERELGGSMAARDAATALGLTMERGITFNREVK